MTDLSATGPSAHDFSADGGCGCGAVRFRLTAAPLFVNCCHCSRCQRGSGAAFAVNAVIETSQVTLLSGDLEASLLPTESGSSQEVMRCSSCKTAVWSHYQRGGNKLAFVRVGTIKVINGVPQGIALTKLTDENTEIWQDDGDGIAEADEFSNIEFTTDLTDGVNIKINYTQDASFSTEISYTVKRWTM